MPLLRCSPGPCTQHPTVVGQLEPIYFIFGTLVSLATCSCVHVHTAMRVHTRAVFTAYIHKYIHVCMHDTYVHIYTYIHTYIHTYIDANARTPKMALAASATGIHTCIRGIMHTYIRNIQNQHETLQRFKHSIGGARSSCLSHTSIHSYIHIYILHTYVHT